MVLWANLDSSRSELMYLASKTICNDSLLAKIITVFMNAFSFGCSSLFTGEMISFCSNILTLSFKGIGTLLARYILKTLSGFRGRCSGEFTSPTSNLDGV